MGCLFLSSVLLLGAFSGGPQEDKKKPPPSFEELASCIGSGGPMQYMQCGYVPPVSAWVNLKGAELPSFKDFPKELVKALNSPGTKDFETALNFIQVHAAVARTCAFERGKKDLEAATHRSFAPWTKPIQEALVKALDAEPLSIRWKAASALLAFKSNDGKANLILAEGARTKDKTFRQQNCEMIGMLHLSHPDAIKILIRALRDETPEVRRQAANVVCQIGSEAKAAVPALINLLESGEAARGLVETPFAIRELQIANLALLALSVMGPAARPAVPVILRRFPKEDKGEQHDMLTFLAGIGTAARESTPLLEKVMQSANQGLRVRAACVLLRLTPDHPTAAKLVKSALASEDEKTRAQAIQICVEIGPPSKILVAALTGLLDDENEETRILASKALGHIGPDAAPAIPALEKLLTKKDDHMKHTFLSHQAAGFALGRIGKASVPALIRATAAKSGGRVNAILALGFLGQDASPAVKCLIEILGTELKEDNRGPFMAAIALGNLGEHARSARRALEQRRGEAEMGLVIEWALMEIPR
jgi:HEAT repeat protein